MFGQTKGRTRNDRYSTLRVPIKDIYLYPLLPNFREALHGVTSATQSAWQPHHWRSLSGDLLCHTLAPPRHYHRLAQGNPVPQKKACLVWKSRDRFQTCLYSLINCHLGWHSEKTMRTHTRFFRQWTRKWTDQSTGAQYWWNWPSSQ